MSARARRLVELGICESEEEANHMPTCQIVDRLMDALTLRRQIEEVDEARLSDFDRSNVGEILAGHGDWWSADMLRLIKRSDRDHRNLLRRVVPVHVWAVEQWESETGARHVG